MEDTQSNQAQILDADSRCEVNSVAPEPAESLTANRAHELALGPAIGVPREEIMRSRENPVECRVRKSRRMRAQWNDDISTEVTATMRRHDDHWATLRHFARNAGRSSEVVVA